MELFEIISHFKVRESPQEVNEINDGLINKTYKIHCGEEKYILQKINTSVFKNSKGLFDNFQKITDFIKRKEIPLLLPEIIKTRNEENFYIDANKNIWRVLKYIPGNTFHKLENENQASELGEIFGAFHSTFKSFPLNEIQEVIRDFHNTQIRLDSLKKSYEIDTFSRRGEVKSEMAFLLKMEKELIFETDIPKRLVHQDAKLSNVLFNDAGKAIAIIDLDTIGAGYIAHDFGDIVRSAMNTKSEDEKSIDTIDFEMTFFESFIKPYADQTKSFLQKEEVESLMRGALQICYEQAIRFLDDYLSGDRYFKTKYERHNLIRTRNQIAYLKVLLDKREKLTSLIESAFLN